MKQIVYDVAKDFLKKEYNISEKDINDVMVSTGIEIEPIWLNDDKNFDERVLERNKKELNTFLKALSATTGQTIIYTAAILQIISLLEPYVH